MQYGAIQVMSTDQQVVELEKILSTMDVPIFRAADLGWLDRNLSIRNWAHPDLVRAKELIASLRKRGIKP
jgi:hypothetical protein